MRRWRCRFDFKEGEQEGLGLGSLSIRGGAFKVGAVAVTSLRPPRLPVKKGSMEARPVSPSSCVSFGILSRDHMSRCRSGNDLGDGFEQLRSS